MRPTSGQSNTGNSILTCPTITPDEGERETKERCQVNRGELDEPSYWRIPVLSLAWLLAAATDCSRARTFLTHTLDLSQNVPVRKHFGL
jgi:hypothetical protein